MLQKHEYLSDSFNLTIHPRAWEPIKNVHSRNKSISHVKWNSVIRDWFKSGPILSAPVGSLSLHDKRKSRKDRWFTWLRNEYILYSMQFFSSPLSIFLSFYHCGGTGVGEKVKCGQITDSCSESNVNLIFVTGSYILKGLKNRNCLEFLVFYY